DDLIGVDVLARDRLPDLLRNLVPRQVDVRHAGLTGQRRGDVLLGAVPEFDQKLADADLAGLLALERFVNLLARDLAHLAQDTPELPALRRRRANAVNSGHRRCTSER